MGAISVIEMAKPILKHDAYCGLRARASRRLDGGWLAWMR